MSEAEHTEPPEGEADPLDLGESEADELRRAFDDLDLNGSIDWELAP